MGESSILAMSRRAAGQLVVVTKSAIGGAGLGPAAEGLEGGPLTSAGLGEGGVGPPGMTGLLEGLEGPPQDQQGRTAVGVQHRRPASPDHPRHVCRRPLVARQSLLVAPGREMPVALAFERLHGRHARRALAGFKKNA